MHFIEYTALVILYFCIACVTGGYLYKKVGTTDGPDGLIPVFGAIFWPLFFIRHDIVYVIEFLISLGAKLG